MAARFDDLEAALRRRAYEKVEFAATRLMIEWDQNVPQETGALGASRDIDIIEGEDEIVFRVSYPLDYAKSTDTGSEEGVIYVKNADTLKFWGTNEFEGQLIDWRTSVRRAPRQGTKWFSGPLERGAWESYLEEG